MKGLGFIASPDDARDIIFSASAGLSSLPEDYLLRNVHRVVDQGSDSTCAAISLSHIIDWQASARDLVVKGNTVSNIYALREDKEQEGMVPRQALSALKHEGVGGYKIKGYARVNDPVAAREAILTNGPVMACYYAYDNNRFWIPSGAMQGGHAVLLTGWEGGNFRLQNSWGYEWGTSGTMDFPDTDWRYVVECWTIML